MRAPGQHRAGRRRLPVADEQRTRRRGRRLAGGSWVKGQPTLTLDGLARGRDGRDRRRAARARDSWRGARRWPRRSGRRSATRTTGAGPYPGSATRARASWSSAWRPPRTARTAPVGCSPATARASGCTARCTVPASPTSPTSTSRDDGLRLDRRVHHRRRALRAARQQADDRRSATRAGRTCAASSRCSPTPRVFVALGRSRTRRCAERSACGRGRSSVTASRCRARRAAARSCARSTRASRTPSPASSPATMLDAVFTRAVELVNKSEGDRRGASGVQRISVAAPRPTTHASKARGSSVSDVSWSWRSDVHVVPCRRRGRP